MIRNSDNPFHPFLNVHEVKVHIATSPSFPAVGIEYVHFYAKSGIVAIVQVQVLDQMIQLQTRVIQTECSDCLSAL